MKKLKSISALIAVVLLVSLYIVTFIAAFFNSPTSSRLFTACLISTFIIPVLLYAYMLVYRILKKRREEQEEIYRSMGLLSDEKNSDKNKKK